MTLGYMVMRDDFACFLGDDGILYRCRSNGPATVFPTRRAALRAITQTNAFDRAEGYGWASYFGGLRIIRLSEPGSVR